MRSNPATAAWLRPFCALSALLVLLVLGGCGGGSGAPNNPFTPTPATPGPLFLLPAVATVYASTPATLTISGGAPPYRSFTSNASVLPISQSSDSATIVLLPTNVSADTVVVVTAQDSVGQTASSSITVKPAPIFGSLVVKPNATTCGTNAICSGQTATAQVTVTGPGSAGIPNRQVTFEVVTGEFAIQSTNPAQPLVSSLTVVSDANGLAQVLIKANVVAFTQPALLRATEVTTGNQVTAQFTIVQTINGSAVLTVVPATTNITGAYKDSCSSGFRIDYFIYGGTPPYRVTSTFPNAVTVLGSPVSTSGGFFEAITNGTCVDPLVFSILDATGLQTTATLTNAPGTLDRPVAAPAPALAMAPGTVSAKCTAGGAQVTLVVTGGTAPYNVYATPTGPMPITVATRPANVFTFDMPPVAGAYLFTAVDSTSPQKTATSTVTCS